VYGRYVLLDNNNPDVYAYTRELDGKKWLIMLNFSGKPAKGHTGLNPSGGMVVMGNYPAPSRDENLRPYEAVIISF
jgi:oligo-1,6-glucosidase